MCAHDSGLFVRQNIDKAGIQTPLLKPADKLLPEKIVANRRNRIRGNAKFLQMISDIDGSSAGEETTRQAIPEHFTKTKDGRNGRLSHRAAK